MSFKIAKPRVVDIQKGSPIISRAEQAACGLCKKIQARYSCPSCNVPYCSLECFRGEEHRDCSEGFYRSVIEDEIRSAPDRSNEEKRGMMQILKRMEDPEAFPKEEDETDSDDEGIAAKLQSLDIDSADTDSLWDALSPSQKAAFTQAMKDPNSSLAQQLLHSLESETTAGDQTRTPWWETEGQLEGDISQTGDLVPSPLTVPESLFLEAQRGWNEGRASLLFNVVCLCLSYSYCIRALQIPSFSVAEPQDTEACRAMMSQTSQFLTDRKSATKLEDIDASIAYVQSRLEEPVYKLLPDVYTLFRPELVLDVSLEQVNSSGPLPGSTACWRLLACLGDIASLYATPSSPSTSSKKVRISTSTDKATVHKLTFYTSHVMAAPTAHLRQMADKLARMSVTLSAEEKDEPLELEKEKYHPERSAGSSDLRFSCGARGDPGLSDAFTGIEEFN